MCGGAGNKNIGRTFARVRVKRHGPGGWGIDNGEDGAVGHGLTTLASDGARALVSMAAAWDSCMRAISAWSWYGMFRSGRVSSPTDARATQRGEPTGLIRKHSRTTDKCPRHRGDPKQPKTES